MENSKYCWLNINTGSFSNSWNEQEHKTLELELRDPKFIQQLKDDGVKLIKFECISDPEFEFFNKMQLK